MKFVFEVIYMKTQEQHTGASFIWQKSLKTVVVEAAMGVEASFMLIILDASVVVVEIMEMVSSCSGHCQQ